MSRICAVLGVKEGQIFAFGGKRYMIDGNELVRLRGDGSEIRRMSNVSIRMINAAEKIAVVQKRLTQNQRRALEAIFVLYGDGWLVSSNGMALTFSGDKPERVEGKYAGWLSAESKMRDLKLSGRVFRELAIECTSEPMPIRATLAENGVQAETMNEGGI